MDRTDGVVAAAKRRSNEVLGLVAAEALRLQAQANNSGAMGGSRHLLELAKICRDGMRRVADAVSAEIGEYDSGAFASYRSQFTEILNAAKPKLMGVFRGYGGDAPSFGRTSPNEQRELSEALDKAITDLSEEFDLRATKPNAGDATTANDDWAFAVLRHFSKVRSAHKINVLGRPFQSGHLEAELGVRFTDVQRAAVAKVIGELLRNGLLAPTYSDVAEPENWLAITDQGREALDRGALDELDLALAALDARFPSIRRGAWAAGMTGNPDSVRHVATSGRELLGQVLEAVAPDDEVRATPGFVPSQETSGGITRKMRFRHATKKRPSGMSDSDIEVMLGAEALLEPLYKKLNALAHSRGATTRDVKTYLQATEMLLGLLLL